MRNPVDLTILSALTHVVEFARHETPDADNHVRELLEEVLSA